ncbi:MAG: TetR/AcrR family transcriptional regulator [Gemmatimonadales bacterium]
MKRDTDDTRERILAAAHKLFAEFGFSATSVRDITGAAGVNLSAVSYHFASKDLLYHELLRTIVGPLAHVIEGLARREASPLDRLEWIVRAFFAHIRAHPDMPSFMMRELSLGRTPSAPIVEMMSRILPAVSGVIAQGQQLGEIRAGDPVLLTFSVIAQPIHLYLARGAIAAVTGLDVNDPQSLERVVEHVVVTVRRALEAR